MTKYLSLNSSSLSQSRHPLAPKPFHASSISFDSMISLDDISFKVLSHKGSIQYIGNEHFNIKKQEQAEGTLFIYIDKDQLQSRKDKIKLGVYSNEKLIEEVSTNFPGPMVID